jgi:uncharacterized protein YjbJ (UPF0337 family)
MLRSQPSLTNTGRQEAVRTDPPKKTGSSQRRICDLALPLEDATNRSVSEETENSRRQMKPSTKDQVKGKVHEVKGKFKEKAGQLTNDPGLAAKGKAEKVVDPLFKRNEDSLC